MGSPTYSLHKSRDNAAMGMQMNTLEGTIHSPPTRMWGARTISRRNPGVLCTNVSQSTLSQEKQEHPFLSQSFVFLTLQAKISPPICLLNPCYKAEHLPLLIPRGNHAREHSSLRIFLLWKGVMFFNSFLLGILKLHSVSINWLMFPKPHFLCWFRYNTPWLLMIFLIPY